jgi:potassium voltage-gated channel Shaw-related subfamily C protein 1
VYFACIILAVIGSILRTLPDYKTNTSILTTFDQIEYVCMIFFSVEFVVRLLICPSLVGFFMSVLNYVDILPLIPFYASLFSKLVQLNGYSVIISLKEIFKMFLLFKFFRRSRSLNTLVNTLKKSFKELILYLLYLGLAILIFSRYFDKFLQANNNIFSSKFKY